MADSGTTQAGEQGVSPSAIGNLLHDKWSAEYPARVPYRRMISDVVDLLHDLKAASPALPAIPPESGAADEVVRFARNLLAVSRAVGVLGATEVSEAEEALEAILTRGAAQPPESRSATHWAGCWRTHGHHACAIAEVERGAAQQREPDAWIVEHTVGPLGVIEPPRQIMDHAARSFLWRHWPAVVAQLECLHEFDSRGRAIPVYFGQPLPAPPSAPITDTETPEVQG